MGAKVEERGRAQIDRWLVVRGRCGLLEVVSGGEKITASGV